MQFTILAFAAMAAAIPAMIQERAPGSVCPALDTPLCCQADVDGVADVTCEAPSDSSSVQAFKNSCASSGTTAKCCVLPLAGDALLCSSP
ncbi:Cryparin [Sphaerulina musiva]